MKAYQRAQEVMPPGLVAIVIAVAVMVTEGIVVVVGSELGRNNSQNKIINKRRHMLFGSVYIYHVMYSKTS